MVPLVVLCQLEESGVVVQDGVQADGAVAAFVGVFLARALRQPAGQSEWTSRSV